MKCLLYSNVASLFLFVSQQRFLVLILRIEESFLRQSTQELYLVRLSARVLVNVCFPLRLPANFYLLANNGF